MPKENEVHPSDAIVKINEILRTCKEWHISGELHFTDLTNINTPDDLIYHFFIDDRGRFVG